MIYFSLWVLILLALLLGDSFGSPTTSARVLPFLAYHLIVPTLVASFFLAYKWQIRIYEPLRRLLLVLVLPFLFLVTLGLSYLGSVTEVNQVFAWTRLHQSQLGIVVLYLSSLLLLNQSSAWWKKYLDTVLLYLPFVLGGFLLMARLWPMNYFLEIVKEDRIIEYAQFFMLLAGGLGTAYFVSRAWRVGVRDLRVYFLALLSLGLLVVAGDEISWGQRLLGIETPESISRISRQNDITLHNLDYFEWLVGRAYLTLALLGLFARPLLTWLLGRKALLVSLAPTAIFAGYFLFPAFYHGYSLTTEFGVWREWSEPIELYLYAGLALWALYRASKLKKI